MSKQQHRFTFRLDKDTWIKLRYIADQNCRTINKELEMLINKHLTEYEQLHGVISPTDINDLDEDS